MSKRTNTRAMVECALMIAVGTVLAQIKIFTMPYGGSVTLVSMLPFILVSFRHGVKWGLFTGFINGLLQLITGFYAPPSGTLTALVAMILLDYLLAFMALGLAQGFAKPFKNRLTGVAVGTATVCFLRFICSFLSGALLWGSYQSYYEWAAGLSVWEYSFIYNGTYMLPELIITSICACLLVKLAPKFFDAQ
ncbi:MAG: energy-coupled thiamine transporter ThiT [Oscillospiraceae bacterium]|nr:energy-coupled thiamine transporter ThiT [Oscillospiraceae bacterium]MBP1553167.1 energy-coupled thiamine transporter ThiT [Oscillospiraceae bacterium]MBP1570873.1 energy-coupled thiamine transporter ThiT [Oscillospiraceae bacterium]